MGNSRSDEAIKLAVQGRWEEAMLVNQDILEVSPSDIDALNRLGKALSELGRISDSRQTYQRVLEVDPHNSIARKNLDRLSRLKDESLPSKQPRGIDSQFFIEETSKARRVSLRQAASREILGKLAPGDPVYLRVQDGKLEVVSDFGDYIGEVDQKIGARLARLMEGGNQYKAAVVNLGGEEIKVIIRETYQHPSQAKYPSFPPPKTIEEIRPYLKDSMVKREIEIEPPEDEEAEWDGEEESPDESTLDFEDEEDVVEGGKSGRVR